MLQNKAFTKSLVLFSFLVLLIGISTASETNLLIKAKKIYTAEKNIILDAQILISGGKIVRIGKNITPPENTKHITADTVIPGLIDIHTHLGVYSLPMVQENSDGNEMTNPATPQVRALDSFNFDDPALRVGLAGGVTTIISRPGSGNVIGGTSVAVKLKKAPPAKMVIKEIVDLKMAIEGNPVGVYGAKNQLPTTLMGVYHVARKAFLEAREYQKSWEKFEQENDSVKETNPPKKDLGKEIMVMALKREIPVHIHCATASEIMSCIRLAKEFDLQLSLGHCYWAYLIVDELKNHKDVHFNVGPPMFFNYYQNALNFKNTPAILSQAGLEVSLQTDALGGGQQNLRQLATLCVRYGMDKVEALKSITLNAAKAVNLADRIGSIKPGKDADLVLLDGEPFELLTSVERVIVDGKIEYENRTTTGQYDLSIPEAQQELVLPPNIADTHTFAIQAGTIFTMAGSPIKNGTILVKAGRIAKVGAGVKIPADYPVIKAGEFTIIPGLINPRSYVGIASNWRRQSSIDEVSNPIVPHMEVKHAIEPQAPHFSFSRELGITTVMVTPGNRNVIGGQGVVVKTTGKVTDKMIAKDHAVMVFGMGVSAKRSSRMPSTRMGIAALLRETLTKAQEYRDKKEKGKPDLSMEALLPVLAGKMPVLVHCERQDDILTTLRIADEFGIKIILDGATDAYKVVEQIKKHNIPVIIENLFRGAGNIEDLGFNPKNPALLAEAGIKVAFRAAAGSWSTPGAGSPGGDLLEIASFAVKNGMPVYNALQAVTINAAEIIGMADKLGSLEPGKEADLLILRGHPFRTGSTPAAVFIGGKLVYKSKSGDHL